MWYNTIVTKFINVLSKEKVVEITILFYGQENVHCFLAFVAAPVPFFAGTLD
jgi:hypothetical protein